MWVKTQGSLGTSRRLQHHLSSPCHTVRIPASISKIRVPFDAEFQGNFDGALKFSNQPFPKELQRRKVGPSGRALVAGLGAHQPSSGGAVLAALSGPFSDTAVGRDMVQLPSKGGGPTPWQLCVPSKNLAKTMAGSHTCDTPGRHAQRRKVGAEPLPPGGSLGYSLCKCATMGAMQATVEWQHQVKLQCPRGAGAAFKKAIQARLRPHPELQTLSPWKPMPPCDST